MERIIVNNFGQEEFFVNEAIGWSLREYSKTNPVCVRNFLVKYKDMLALLSIREASKYLEGYCMSLSEIIYKRKSVRKYKSGLLDEKVLQDVQAYFAKIKPLYDDIAVNFSIVGKESVKGIASLFSPHYIVAMSENKKGYLVNVGFMLQQMDLYLSSIGLGGCWLGMVHPKATLSGGDMEFVIVFGFGTPDESLYRELDGFKRKSLDKISNNVADSRLEVVRLAPSAMNLQHYYFVTEDNTIHVYCAKAGVLTIKRLAKMREIDVGIALAHLYVANSECFSFFETENPKELKGYNYMGSVQFNS